MPDYKTLAQEAKQRGISVYELRMEKRAEREAASKAAKQAKAANKRNK